MSTQNRRGGLDRYDVAILSELSKNTRLTTVELANMVHLSRTAVSRRIAALKRNRILNDDAEILDYASLGFKVRAIVEITAASRTAEQLRQQLLFEPEILNVSTIAGDGLMSLDVIATDTDHLHRFVRSLQKSGSTSTKIVFAAEKSRLSLIERMRKIEASNDTNVVSA